MSHNILKDTPNNQEIYDSLPRVGLLFYSRKMTEDDIPHVMTEEQYNLCKGYEPMFKPATYSEYEKAFEKVEAKYTNYFKQQSINMACKIAFDQNNMEWTRKQIEIAESDKLFVNWITNGLIIEYFKNYGTL